MLDRITYRCKNCGWNKSISAAWADLKPKKCPNKICDARFILNPEMLEIILPEPPAQEEPKVKRKR